MKHEYADEKCKCGHLRMEHEPDGPACWECACTGFESDEEESPMTDPKPATPATDEEIAEWTNDSAKTLWRCGVPAINRLLARISADAEIIKAARQERDAVKEALVEARETTRKQAEEIERLKAKRADDGNEYVYVMELREQVETLREALRVENAELRGTIDRLLECCGDIQLKRAILAARKEQEASNGKS